jgi:hypothetical protein
MTAAQLRNAIPVLTSAARLVTIPAVQAAGIPNAFHGAARAILVAAMQSRMLFRWEL